jgi:hypothetical protein
MTSWLKILNRVFLAAPDVACGDNFIYQSIKEINLLPTG